MSVFCIWIKQIKLLLPCRHILCAKKGLKSHYILTLLSNAFKANVTFTKQNNESKKSID